MRIDRLREIDNKELVKTFRDDLAGQTYHIFKSNNTGGDAEFTFIRLSDYIITETLTEQELLTKYQITF